MSRCRVIWPGELVPHEVRTVPQMGRAGLSNGDLLHRAKEAGFDALVTGDQGIEYQQKVAPHGIAIVVLRAHTNRMSDLLPLVPGIRQVLASLCPGQVVRVDA